MLFSLKEQVIKINGIFPQILGIKSKAKNKVSPTHSLCIEMTKLNKLQEAEPLLAATSSNLRDQKLA